VNFSLMHEAPTWIFLQSCSTPELILVEMSDELDTWFFFLLRYVDLNVIMTIFKFQIIITYSHSLGDGRWLFPGPSPISNPVSKLLETMCTQMFLKLM